MKKKEGGVFVLGLGLGCDEEIEPTKECNFDGKENVTF